MTNRALGNGGAIDSWLSSIAVDSSLFLSNVASQDGGAIKVGDSNLTLCDCRLENNTATYGGGVAVHDSNLTMTNVHFINNEAHYHGGAVHADDSNVIMEAALLMNNSAINGGALSLDNEDRAVVTTSLTFHSNFARDRGGAIAVRWRSTITINDSNIYNNIATWGTAISNCNGCTEISDLTGTTDPIFTYCTIYEGDNDRYHQVISDRLDIWCSANASLSPVVNEAPLSIQETLTKWSSTFFPTDDGNLTDESTTIISYYGDHSDATTTYLATSIVTVVSTDFSDKCSSIHSDTGYIVAIMIVSMFCLILLGYIAFSMGSHQMQSLLTSKRASHEAKIDPLKMVNNEQKFGKYSEEESLTSTCDSVKL